MPPRPSSPDSPGGASTPTGRVLVADDDATVQRAWARVLGQAGYEVELVSDGKAASVAIENGAFDVIVTDISMPNVDGIELLRFLRVLDLDIPVILATGAPTLETAVQAVEHGAFHYLTKPIDGEQLVGAVRRAMRLKRMADLKRHALQLLAAMETGTGDKAGLEASFESAVSTLWMAYQPIVRSNGQVFGYEALMRSNEPRLPHPGALLDAAERLGKIAALGRTVRERASAPFGGAPDDSLLFVNLHTRELLDDSLVDPASPLSKLASRTVLEITERAALHDVKNVRARVGDLRALGFRIAIDDLGAGYAGLTSFALLEPEFVKIDMSLVRDVDKQPLKQKLIGSIVHVCREMGMLVVCEGVETEQERSVLSDLGTDLLQGYLFGRPQKTFAVPTT